MHLNNGEIFNYESLLKSMNIIKDHEKVYVSSANEMVIFRSFEQNYFNLDGSDC